jgi:uncharacterized protein (TIGR00730 family)
MTAICVYLSSSNGRPSDVAAVQALGGELARTGTTLVYGGAARGLMGVLADAALAGGGKVVGVIPQTLVDLEVAHRGLTELHVVETMHQRKAMMFARADGFVVAPGGFGTLEEAFEVLTGVQLAYHAKPIRFLDVDGFWGGLAEFLDHALEIGVLKPGVRDLFRIAPSATAAVRDILDACPLA